MTETMFHKLENQMVNEHFLNPRKCLSTMEKGNKSIAKLTIVKIYSSMQLLLFILMVPP